MPVIVAAFAFVNRQNDASLPITRCLTSVTDFANDMS